jgi:putative NADH-flavin reductase
MKKVAVIGATGFLGSLVVKELVNRGYEVLAIARDSSKVLESKQISAVSLDVNEVDALAEVLKGVDAVVSTFNGGWSNPNIYEDFMGGAANIEKAVEKSGVKRLVVVGGAGSLYVADGLQLIDTSNFPETLKPGAGAARDYLNVLKNNTSLDWTFFSPAIEMHQGTSGVRRGSYRTSLDTPVFDENGRSILSGEDVAVVLVDEIEQNRFIKQRFTAAY